MSEFQNYHMTDNQRLIKRLFDIFASLVGLLLLWPVIFLGWIAAAISTGKNGFYFQTRIGRFGKPFKLIKLRSMREVANIDTTVTTGIDPRITVVGKLLRKSKLDELPQLINVLRGDMSLVGPRPDVPGFADELVGEQRLMLQLRPGITGPASLRFRNEEEILENQQDPEHYNRTVIWPEKVEINCRYVRNYSFFRDIGYILKTIFPT